MALVALGVLGAACSSGSNSASPTTSMVGTTPRTGQGTATATPAVTPCKTSLMSIFAASSASPSNDLFSPATGKTTPQDAIKEVVGLENGQGLIAMCPYMTSLTAWDIMRVATLLTGGTTDPAMENVLLNGSEASEQKVAITRLNCKAAKCSADVSTSASTLAGSSTSGGTVEVTKYGSAWFVTQYLTNGGSGSAHIGS